MAITAASTKRQAFMARHAFERRLEQRPGGARHMLQVGMQVRIG